MIEVDAVTMGYPKPRRYRDLVLRPFGARDQVVALRDVSVAVQGGERVGFLGPNGAGKTTLLKLIAGLLLPSHGTVAVNGHDSNRDNDGVRASCSLVMNEERSFYWRLSGRQNLEFFGALQNLRGRLQRITGRNAIRLFRDQVRRLKNSRR